MTDIQPGPWMFLQNLGEAAGNFLQGREERRVRRRQEAGDAARNFLALRAAGLMSPKQFEDPSVQAVFHMAGYGPPSSEPTPEERKSQLQGEYLTALDQPDTEVPLPLRGLGGIDTTVKVPATAKFTDEQRAIVGAPTKSALSAERIAQKKGANVEQALTTGTPLQKEALSGVPNAITTQTEVEAARDKQYTSLAERSVDASITAGGGDILKIGATPNGIQTLSGAAWELAQQDAKSRGYVLSEELTRPYIDAAVASRFREERIKALQATARGGDTPADYLKLLVDQQRQATAQLNALPKPSQTDQLLFSFLKSKLDQAKSPAERDQVLNAPENAAAKTAYETVSQYYETAARLTAESRGYADALQGQLPGKLPGAPGAGQTREPAKLSAKQLDAIVARFREKKLDLKVLDDYVSKGQISASDAAVIRQRVSTKGTGKTSAGSGRSF